MEPIVVIEMDQTEIPKGPLTNEYATTQFLAVARKMLNKHKKHKRGGSS